MNGVNICYKLILMEEEVFKEALLMLIRATNHGAVEVVVTATIHRQEVSVNKKVLEVKEVDAGKTLLKVGALLQVKANPRQPKQRRKHLKEN